VPYGRCVIYTYPSDVQDLAERAREGILPIFKQQPGFLAYGVMVQGDQVVSMSAWNSENDAKGADEAAKDWVSKNAADMKVVSSVMGDYAWLEFAQQ
jgi:heme-degrading monooxygenase HmoA